MHHHFGSQFLIDSLNSSGFSSSYSEVIRFEMSAACSQGTDILGITPGHFVQFVADNADHNVRTLDRIGTFHGMKIIAALTPGMKKKTDQYQGYLLLLKMLLLSARLIYTTLINPLIAYYRWTTRIYPLSVTRIQHGS